MSPRSVPVPVLRVMILDDHEIVRHGLRALVDALEGFEVCAEAGDAASALKIATNERPDVVIADLSLPDMCALDIIPKLKRELPGLEVVVLTWQENDLVCGQALLAGAQAFVFKSDPVERLIEALKAVALHQRYLSRPVPDGFLGAFLNASTREPGRLTPRGRQVVRLVAQGRSNKMVGQLLGITVKTVESHRASAMRKVGARSMADLTRYAARNHLIEL